MNRAGCSQIVLLTDFGIKDAFSGILKGVIACVSPESKVIDLSHGIRPQDILQGAFVLSNAFAFFPAGSIFCVVVDPGVGSDRKGICIETTDYYFVGPDNGILWEAASQNGIKRIIDLTRNEYWLPEISNTFHGRDIFAPVSGHLSKGVKSLTLLGDSLDHCVKLEFPKVEKKGSVWELAVLNVDHFGNIALNIRQEEFYHLVGKGAFCISMNDHQISKKFNAYAEAPADELFIVVSSDGYIEICMRNASAADQVRLKGLNRVLLEKG